MFIKLVQFLYDQSNDIQFEYVKWFMLYYKQLTYYIIPTNNMDKTNVFIQLNIDFG